MRRAEIRTEFDDADAVAASVRPDDTDQMDTRVEDGAVVTTIERETTGGLRATVDDYVVNLDVARRTADAAARTVGVATGTVDATNRTDPKGDRHDTRP